jgi:serine/threonine protein kinase
VPASALKNSTWLKGRWPWGRAAAPRQGGAGGGPASADGDELRAPADERGHDGGGRGRPEDEKPSWNFEPGTPIAEGRTVLRRLSGGNRYEVFLTWDERLFAITVTKVLRPDQASDPHALGELRREVGALRRLAHPCLVRCFGAELEGPHPHVVLEHLEGPTLRRLIKQQGTLPLDQLLPVALHVAAVLQYMATEGFVHLDVKPSNIVMGVPPRLIDLSIAQDLESAAALRHSMGTDAYMPPEQCDPAAWPGRVGPAADVWGLGATLHHALSGETPFPRGDAGSRDKLSRFPQLSHDPKPLPAHVPETLQELVARMLAHDPAGRPAASEVATTLEPLVASIVPKLRASRRGIRAG